MFKVTITRTRPNSDTSWFTNKSQNYLQHYENNYKEKSNWEVTLHDDTTLVVVRTSDDRSLLEKFVGEFSDVNSPFYESVIYENENNITLSFSEITEV